MRVAIRGFKKVEDLKKLLDDKIELKFVIDINANIWGDVVDSITIISPMRAFEEWKKGSYEKILIDPRIGVKKIMEILEELKKFGFPLEVLRILNIDDINEGLLLTEKDIVSEKYHIDNFKTLYYLEYHIADKCNLNCAGCSHFSPLVKEEFYPNVMNVKKDMERLHEIVNNIEWIRVMGGEPFLNKDWKKYLQVTRKIWKNSKISIVTNGILLNRLVDSDYEFLRENKIWIDISLYKPLWNKVDEVIKLIKSKRVNYEVNGTPIFNFTSVFNLESTDDFIDKRKRCNAPCTNLYKGKITPCPIMMYTSFFNEYFLTNLPEGYSLDIYEEGLEYKKFIQCLEKPMHICKYCDMSELKMWKQSDCLLEDWIVME